MEKFERLYHEQVAIVRTLKADAAILRVNIRDKFAMAALQGWLSTYPEYADFPVQYCKAIAESTYAMADAMMEARLVNKE